MADDNFIYKSILASMSEGLIVTSMKGVVTHCNEAAYELLDMKADDLLGKKIARCFYKYQENDDFNQAILNAIYDRSSTHKTIVSYFNGNSYRQFNITTFFLHENDEKIGIVIVLNDISELTELRDAIKAMERIKKLNTQLEMRNNLLNATFGRYLSDEIVRELLETPGGLQLGGKKRNVTVMMSDLRGFTQISEIMKPNELIDMLNNYLTVMSDIITAHKGTIIEFLGDGILIVFGAPIECDNHAFNAVCSAVEMQVAMPSVNEWNKEKGYPELRMGIGISSGDTIVGNIGSERHTKYGVIGKYVNLCGRIESFTTGSQILISPVTKAAISEPLEIANEFEVMPKGVNSPILLSQITGIGGSYNIHCPKTDVELKALKECFDVTFSVINNKQVNNQIFNGKLVAASKTHAVLLTEENLEDFTNLEIHGETNVFGKILHTMPSGYMVAFTSDSTPLLSKLTFNS